MLSLTFLSAAPASANDKSLRATVIAGGKQFERAADALVFPDDEESPSYVTEYQAGMRKLDGYFVRYGRRVAAERGSTRKGRQARKLLLRGLASMRKGYGLAAKTTLDAEPSTSDLDRASRLYAAAARDYQRAFTLLKIKMPVPDDGIGQGTPDGSYDDEGDGSYDDDSYDDGTTDGEEVVDEAAAA